MGKKSGLLSLVVVCFLSARLVNGQSASKESSASSEPPPPFAQVVNAHFAEWDSDGDGQLSKDEIEAALNNPKIHDESAAAIAAIEKVVRGSKYALPPITKEYLMASPLREPSASEDQIASADDVSKPGTFNHAPAFQPRYLNAMKKLRQTSRELFPEDLPSFQATHQGQLGDCPFVSTVGAMVYRDPAAVKSMFTQNVDRSFTVSLGDGRKVKIVHVTDADIAIWSSAGSNGLWLTVLEKAYRKALVQTEKLKQKKKTDIYDKFASVETIDILDGHQTRKIEFKKIQSAGPEMAAIRKDLTEAQREHRLVKTGTGVGKKNPGITPGHAYAILGYDKESDLVLVWNPHGNNFTPQGPDGLQNGYTTKTGQFHVPLKDMPHIFNDIVFESQAASRR